MRQNKFGLTDGVAGGSVFSRKHLRGRRHQSARGMADCWETLKLSQRVAHRRESTSRMQIPAAPSLSTGFRRDMKSYSKSFWIRRSTESGSHPKLTPGDARGGVRGGGPVAALRAPARLPRAAGHTRAGRGGAAAQGVRTGRGRIPGRKRSCKNSHRLRSVTLLTTVLPRVSNEVKEAPKVASNAKYECGY